MSETSEIRAIAWPITIVCLGLFGFMGYGCDRHMTSEERKLEACVESGGAWLSNPGSCIRVVDDSKKPR